MADLFVVQDEITQAIATALMPKLATERPAPLVNPYTGSIDAYELCLRARYHHQRRTPDGLGMALRLFEQAAARDANCALAYTGVAHVCLLLCYFGWDWAGAEREFLRALELDPDSSEALCRYGLFLWARLRNADALVPLRKALDLDPFSLDANWFLGWVYLSLGQLDQAEELARKMVAMEANSWSGYQLVAWIESVRGRWAEAMRAYERSAEIERGPATLSGLCWCYEKAGKPAEARQTLERLEQLTTTRIVPPTWLALAYDGVGAHAQARACVERAFEERHMLLVHLRGFIAWTGWLSGYRSLLDEYGL